ncbi:MAG: long-chain fatty acid--CoA ligase [Leptospiraceae bacterium]|nr:long-chain fatty acid--CoA ligase [Leptospiraceae bacterium]
MKENLAKIFKELSQRFKDKPAFATRDSQKKFQTISYMELYEKAICLSTALIDLGLQSRHHVGLIADNRLEWILADMAVVLCGAADVPRGTDVTDNDINYIIPHADVEILFVENTLVLEKIQKNKRNLPNVRKMILMEYNQNVLSDSVLYIYDLIQTGKRMRDAGNQLVEERMEEIQPDDLFTLIYTSGTTGAPKGVMLTHKNITSQLKYIPIPIDSSDRVLSILPVWHIFERMFEMASMYAGACTYYSSVKNLRDDLTIVKPTFMASTPRLWESIYAGILNNIEKAPSFKKVMFRLTMFCANHYKNSIRFLTFNELNVDGKNPIFSIFKGLWSSIIVAMLYLPNFVLDKIVLKQIRERTGGCLKGSCSGGGALPYHVDIFFNNIGIPVLEGYGMTETCPILSMRTFQNLVPGTVGPIYGGTKVKLIDINTNEVIYPSSDGYGKKGEIHVSGPQIMKGYYKNQEATDKVLKNGWLNTGDMGIVTYNRCLKIVGRTKETIVLLGGENVEPVPIENILSSSPFINNCIVVGQDKKFLSVLIVPNMEKFKGYGNSLGEISQNQDVKKIIEKEIKRLINSENGFKSFERVVGFYLLPKEFEVGDELTAKLSIKRHVITEKYKNLIEDIYKN